MVTGTRAREQAREHAPSRHLERYREVASVLAGEGLGWIVDEVGASRLAARIRRAPEAGEPTAEEHVRHAFERLGVTFIKVGQALSTRTDLISPELAHELRKLQDQVPAEPFDLMRTVLETELDAPLERSFGSFDIHPAGTASIGQVYRATLPDGTPVAVKVQRPGVRELTEVDLEIALAVLRRAQGRGSPLGDIDLFGLASEFADALRGEFDYVREARNAERLGRALRDDEAAVFPAVHWTHTTARVLALDLLEGVPMNRPQTLDDAGFDRPALALAGIGAYLRMIFDVGFFQADPHPGNFIAMSGDRVGFTDFGRVGTMSVESRERFIDLLHAAVTRDAEEATETLLSLSNRTDIDADALRAEVSRTIDRYHGKELGNIDSAQLLRDTLGLFRRHHLGVPNDFAMMLATLGELEGVGRLLDPSFDFASAVAPFAEKAMRERMRPGRVAERIGGDVRRAVAVFERLPASLDRLLRRAGRGEFRLEVVPADYEKLVASVSELVNRLAFAVVVGALIIGATTLLSVRGMPSWYRVVGEIGLVAALLVSLWLFWSILAAHYRATRKR